MDIEEYEKSLFEDETELDAFQRQRVHEEEAESKAILEDYQHLNSIGFTAEPGWYFPELKEFEFAEPLDPGETFECSPEMGYTTIQNLAADHPLRGIFTLFRIALNRFTDESSREGFTVRVYVYQLTDIYILDLLMHYSRVIPIKLILNPCIGTFKRVQEHADFLLSKARRNRALESLGTPHILLSALSVRLVNLDNLSGYASMHRKSIMLDDISLVGSYNLTTIPGKTTGKRWW